MTLFWRVVRKVRRVRKATKRETEAYRTHKEAARTFVHERLAYWNQLYNFSYNRVAIRDTRSRWGSCSSKQNLNFNYRIIFLPQVLADYIIVHELCHLAHFDHSPRFWATVTHACPHYRELKAALLMIPIQSLNAEMAPEKSRMV